VEGSKIAICRCQGQSPLTQGCAVGWRNRKFQLVQVLFAFVCGQQKCATAQRVMTVQ